MSVEAANEATATSTNIVRYDKFYIRTIPDGVIKVAQIVSSYIVFIFSVFQLRYYINLNCS